MKKMMTVYELIQHLSKYGPDMPVLVQGYEDGYSVPSIAPLDVYDRGEDHEDGAWWSGRYEKLDYADAGTDGQRVVVLSR